MITFYIVKNNQLWSKGYAYTPEEVRTKSLNMIPTSADAFSVIYYWYGQCYVI